MRARLFVGTVLLASASATVAAQSSSSTHARSAAMADASTARADATAATIHNPAVLAELDGTALAVSSQAATSRLWSGQKGRERQRFEQNIFGLGLALATRLPGSRAMRRLRVGLNLYSPPDKFIHLEAPSRGDTPTWTMYGQRLDHLEATAAAGLELTEQLSVGAAMTIRPVLTADTYVEYRQGRGDSTQENVIVNGDRSLRLGAAAVLGAAWRIGPAFAVGATYREAHGGSIRGHTRLVAGSVVIEDEIDFHQTWSPAEAAFGVQLRPHRRVEAAADLGWANWSAYRDIRNEAPQPGFRDIFEVRIGAEWAASELLRVRGGYAFEPTPVPPQVGDSNLLDSDRHVAAVGFGLDLGALDLAPVRIDVVVRGHLLRTQSWDKDLAVLQDADIDAPGQQVDNLGYPGIQAGGQFWQTGLAIVFDRWAGEVDDD